MPLPPPTQNRQPLHTRTVRINSYEREDGQWDLEAELIDTKAYDFPKRFKGMHKAGRPVHHMHLRVTIDQNFTVTEAVAAYDAAPYDAQCSCIAPAYEKLVGLNLLRNFKNEVKARFARVEGVLTLPSFRMCCPPLRCKPCPTSVAKRLRQGRCPAKSRFSSMAVMRLLSPGPW